MVFTFECSVSPLTLSSGWEAEQMAIESISWSLSCRTNEELWTSRRILRGGSQTLNPFENSWRSTLLTRLSPFFQRKSQLLLFMTITAKKWFSEWEWCAGFFRNFWRTNLTSTLNYIALRLKEIMYPQRTTKYSQTKDMSANLCQWQQAFTKRRKIKFMENRGTQWSQTLRRKFLPVCFLNKK